MKCLFVVLSLILCTKMLGNVCAVIEQNCSTIITQSHDVGKGKRQKIQNLSQILVAESSEELSHSVKTDSHEDEQKKSPLSKSEKSYGSLSNSLNITRKTITNKKIKPTKSPSAPYHRTYRVTSQSMNNKEIKGKIKPTISPTAPYGRTYRITSQSINNKEIKGKIKPTMSPTAPYHRTYRITSQTMNNKEIKGKIKPTISPTAPYHRTYRVTPKTMDNKKVEKNLLPTIVPLNHSLNSKELEELLEPTLSVPAGMETATLSSKEMQENVDYMLELNEKNKNNMANKNFFKHEEKNFAKNNIKYYESYLSSKSQETETPAHRLIDDDELDLNAPHTLLPPPTAEVIDNYESLTHFPVYGGKARKTVRTDLPPTTEKLIAEYETYYPEYDNQYWNTAHTVLPQSTDEIIDDDYESSTHYPVYDNQVWNAATTLLPPLTERVIYSDELYLTASIPPPSGDKTTVNLDNYYWPEATIRPPRLRRRLKRPRRLRRKNDHGLPRRPWPPGLPTSRRLRPSNGKSRGQDDDYRPPRHPRSRLPPSSKERPRGKDEYYGPPWHPSSTSTPRPQEPASSKERPERKDDDHEPSSNKKLKWDRDYYWPTRPPPPPPEEKPKLNDDNYIQLQTVPPWLTRPPELPPSRRRPPVPPLPTRPPGPLPPGPLRPPEKKPQEPPWPTRPPGPLPPGPLPLPPGKQPPESPWPTIPPGPLPPPGERPPRPLPYPRKRPPGPLPPRRRRPPGPLPPPRKRPLEPLPPPLKRPPGPLPPPGKRPPRPLPPPGKRRPRPFPFPRKGRIIIISPPGKKPPLLPWPGRKYIKPLPRPGKKPLGPLYPVRLPYPPPRRRKKRPLRPPGKRPKGPLPPPGKRPPESPRPIRPSGPLPPPGIRPPGPPLSTKPPESLPPTKKTPRWNDNNDLKPQTPPWQTRPPESAWPTSPIVPLWRKKELERLSKTSLPGAPFPTTLPPFPRRLLWPAPRRLRRPLMPIRRRRLWSPRSTIPPLQSVTPTGNDDDSKPSKPPPRKRPQENDHSPPRSRPPKEPTYPKSFKKVHDFLKNYYFPTPSTTLKPHISDQGRDMNKFVIDRPDHLFFKIPEDQSKLGKFRVKLLDKKVAARRKWLKTNQLGGSSERSKRVLKKLKDLSDGTLKLNKVEDQFTPEKIKRTLEKLRDRSKLPDHKKLDWPRSHLHPSLFFISKDRNWVPFKTLHRNRTSEEIRFLTQYQLSKMNYTDILQYVVRKLNETLYNPKAMQVSTDSHGLQLIIKRSEPQDKEVEKSGKTDSDLLNKQDSNKDNEPQRPQSQLGSEQPHSEDSHLESQDHHLDESQDRQKDQEACSENCEDNASQQDKNYQYPGNDEDHAKIRNNHAEANGNTDHEDHNNMESQQSNTQPDTHTDQDYNQDYSEDSPSRRRDTYYSRRRTYSNKYDNEETDNRNYKNKQKKQHRKNDYHKKSYDRQRYTKNEDIKRTSIKIQTHTEGSPTPQSHSTKGINVPTHSNKPNYNTPHTFTPPTASTPDGFPPDKKPPKPRKSSVKPTLPKKPANQSPSQKPNSLKPNNEPRASAKSKKLQTTYTSHPKKTPQASNRPEHNLQHSTQRPRRPTDVELARRRRTRPPRRKFVTPKPLTLSEEPENTTLQYRKKPPWKTKFPVAKSSGYDNRNQLRGSRPYYVKDKQWKPYRGSNNYKNYGLTGNWKHQNGYNNYNYQSRLRYNTRQHQNGYNYHQRSQYNTGQHQNGYNYQQRSHHNTGQHQNGYKYQQRSQYNTRQHQNGYNYQRSHYNTWQHQNGYNYQRRPHYNSGQHQNGYNYQQRSQYQNGNNYIQRPHYNTHQHQNGYHHQTRPQHNSQHQTGYNYQRRVPPHELLEKKLKGNHNLTPEDKQGIRFFNRLEELERKNLLPKDISKLMINRKKFENQYKDYIKKAETKFFNKRAVNRQLRRFHLEKFEGDLLKKAGKRIISKNKGLLKKFLTHRVTKVVFKTLKKVTVKVIKILLFKR